MLVQLILLTKYQICENYGIETKLGFGYPEEIALNLGYIGKKFWELLSNEFPRLQ